MKRFRAETSTEDLVGSMPAPAYARLRFSLDSSHASIEATFHNTNGEATPPNAAAMDALALSGDESGQTRSTLLGLAGHEMQTGR